MSPRRSEATRLRRQIATGLPSTRPRRHAGSHGRSQVRPRIPGKTFGLAVEHVRVGVPPLRDQPDVFGHVGVRRARPLAVDDLMVVTGIKGKKLGGGVGRVERGRKLGYQMGEGGGAGGGDERGGRGGGGGGRKGGGGGEGGGRPRGREETRSGETHTDVFATLASDLSVALLPTRRFEFSDSPLTLATPRWSRHSPLNSPL